MGGLEDFMESFGFSSSDALTIIIICALVFMANFAGGLFTSIIRAFGGPILPSKLTSRTSFRLALVTELFLIIYIIYYHTALVPGIETAQIIYWIFVVLASPLLATIGSQLIYLAFAAKIEELRKEGKRQWAAAEGEGYEDDEGDEGDEEEKKDKKG